MGTAGLLWASELCRLEMVRLAQTGGRQWSMLAGASMGFFFALACIYLGVNLYREDPPAPPLSLD